MVGGMQVLKNDEILYSAFSGKRGYELVWVDKAGKEKLRFSPYEVSGYGYPFQEGKLIDVGSYLKFSQGGF